MLTELLEQHPLAAQLIPPMPPADLRDLANDIKEQGQRHPCLTYEGKIIVGWSRYTACITEQIEPQVIEYEGDDPVALIASEDLHRRHMGPADRKKVAKALLDAHPEWSNRRIAHQSGYNRTDVGELRREVEPPVMSETDISLEVPRSSPEQSRRIVGMMGGLPIIEGDVAPTPKPVQTFEEGTTKSGQPRKARGRPAGSGKKVETANTQKEIKPKPLTDLRSEWISVTSARLKTDFRSTVEDIVNMLKDWHGTSDLQRSILARQLVAALGATLP
jgi:ParB-like chromosome segregation protein Spo0J